MVTALEDELGKRPGCPGRRAQNAVQQVKQNTGMKAEDLSDEQLDAAMSELGIEG